MDTVKEIEAWAKNNRYLNNRDGSHFYVEQLLRKYKHIAMLNFKDATLPFSKSQSLKEIKLYYFSNYNSDFCAYSNVSIPINIELEKIRIENRHREVLLKALLEDSVLGKAYRVPKEYQDYKALCNLAKLGYDIFVTGGPGVPKSKKDKVKLFKRREVFMSKNTSNNADREEKALFLIKPTASADAKIKYFNDCPQIKHLMSIPENMTYKEKKEKVMFLFESPPRWRHALKFITQKKI